MDAPLEDPVGTYDDLGRLMHMKHAYSLDREVLGLDWQRGSLYLVGGAPEDSDRYILGNCIVEGTKTEQLGFYFCADLPYPISSNLFQMQIEKTRKQKGNVDFDHIQMPFVYFDYIPNPTVSYVVERIFVMAEKRHADYFVIHHLQDINGGPFIRYRREVQLNKILQLLKTVAETTETVIVVTSTLSFPRRERRIMLEDLAGSPLAEKYCDRVLLIDYSDDFGYRLLILKESAEDGRLEETVIPVVITDKSSAFEKP